MRLVRACAVLLGHPLDSFTHLYPPGLPWSCGRPFAFFFFFFCFLSSLQHHILDNNKHGKHALGGERARLRAGHGMRELGVVPVDGLLELGVLGPQPGHLQLLLLAQVRHLFGLCPRTVGKAGERAARHDPLHPS